VSIGDNLFRDVLELLIVIAVGGMVWTVIGRFRRGELAVHRCPECDRPTSRAYPECRHCGALLPEDR
jgi:hypothetical protein